MTAAPSERARLGDDLLRLLPAEPGTSSSPVSQVVAFHRVSAVSMARVSECAGSLEVAWDVILLSAFVTLMARLAGQELVRLRVCSGQPAMLTIPFETESSFRSIVGTIANGNRSADQPGALEFRFGDEGPVDLQSDTLRLAARVADGGCELWLASSTGLWPSSVLQLWLRYFDHLLTSATARPDVPWKTLSLLEPAHALEFYRELNNTAEPMEPLCLHELVRQQVKRSPGALAVASPSKRFTYLELDQRSDALAGRLRALGAGQNRPVAVYLERTAELPVALLAVLKADSCYVPLDIQDARARIAAILAESRPVAIITDGSAPLPQEFGAIPVVTPAESAGASPVEAGAVAVTPDHQAYVIYTSGTTGKPKGVPIQHSGLVNFIRSMMHTPGFSSEDRLLALAPISFDIASMEMFLPLISGGTVVVADRHTAADPVRLASMLDQFDITLLQATPVTWRLLVSSEWEGKPNLTMTCGGEALPRDLANELRSRGKELWNLYGPTETTICSSKLKVTSETGIVPLGPPIDNTRFYVLDDTGAILPPGVPGELYIGGVGVSPGYLGPPQGIQRFVDDPFAGQPGARMFRTGDLVRLLSGDQFEFFGRLDHQIKLRGFRIELGEIEFALRSFPAVDDAVAALTKDGLGEPYLIAYVTAAKPQLDLEKLRDHICQLLPFYMVPARFVLMETFPLTGSGKIDRKALAASASSALGAFHQPEGVKPANELEEKLLTIFREVLSTPGFGVTDSFFGFGGYSLLTVKLFTRINRALKVRLPVSMLFDAPTVRALAAAIERSPALPALVQIRSRGTSAPLFVIHSYLLYEVLCQVVEPHRPVFGLRESLESAPQNVEDSAAAYIKEMVKVCPEGPFLLTGWCAAGSLTLEIARQLRQQNRQVGLVALLDAERPGYRPSVRGKRLAILGAKAKFHWVRLRGSSMRQKLRYVGDVLSRGWEAILEKLFVSHRPWVLRLQRIFGPLLPRSVFDNSWSRIGALQKFSAPSYPGKVVLFRAADVPVLHGGDESMGWDDIVEGGVEVVFVPGDHESMFRKPNLQFLSQRFRQALQ